MHDFIGGTEMHLLYKSWTVIGVILGYKTKYINAQ